MIFLRRSSSPSLLMSTPSIKMAPSLVSIILRRDKNMVDLPEPVLPTTPIYFVYYKPILTGGMYFFSLFDRDIDILENIGEIWPVLYRVIFELDVSLSRPVLGVAL